VSRLIEFSRLLAALIVLAVLGVTIATPTALTRPFWLDETLTFLIASDPSVEHALAALSAGVDTNPPGLHLLMRLAGDAFGHSPLVYRLVALASTGLALAGLFVLVARSHSAAAARVSILALLCLPIVIDYSIDARFYGPMLALTTWTCVAIERRRGRRSVGSTICVALLSTGLCLIHYFGAMVLLSIVSAQVFIAWRRAAWREIDAVWPTLAGFVASACCVPLLTGQRAALATAGGTWMEDDLLSRLLIVREHLLPFGFVLIVVLAMVWSMLKRRALTNRPAFGLPASLLGLLAFIPIMLLVEFTVQPVLAPRYLLPAVLPLAALAGVMVAGLASTMRVAVAFVMVCLFASNAFSVRQRLVDPDPRSAVAMAQVRVGPGPVIVDWRGYALPMTLSRPDADQVRLLDDPSLRCPALDRSIVFERKMAEINRLFYAVPGAASVDQVNRLDAFTLVTEFPEQVSSRFEGFDIRQTGPLVFELRRDTTPTAGVNSME
jgi:uncharacterized membrane protein